jgi:Helicase conserved C-terminal domain
MGCEERLKAQESFRHDPEVQVLLATDAAGEGINLQRAHLIVNYDLPWNPNRLEQRFGRIHRIGQTEVCHLWNLVAEETREGDVYRTLLDKLDQACEALGGQIFDVFGKLQFEGRTLRDLLVEAIRYGERPEVRARRRARGCTDALSILSEPRLGRRVVLRVGPATPQKDDQPPRHRRWARACGLQGGVARFSRILTHEEYGLGIGAAILGFQPGQAYGKCAGDVPHGIASPCMVRVATSRSSSTSERASRERHWRARALSGYAAMYRSASRSWSTSDHCSQPGISQGSGTVVPARASRRRRRVWKRARAISGAPAPLRGRLSGLPSPPAPPL